ncbi:insect cuticle protein domain-containing protein [Phthorimaea operculella]|nr:insect cuticle protein domain-containing protein [Phthorimaea operculella]
MKLQIVAVLAVVAVACAAPQNRADAEAQIVSQQLDVQPDGAFNSAVQTSNGISAQAQGELKTVPGEDNKPVPALIIRGSYSYVDNEGKQHQVVYVADENGYQAQSDDIPVAPVA